MTVETAELPATSGRRRGWVRRAPVGVLLVAVTWLLGWPILMLLVGMFRDAPPGQGGAWTFSEIGAAYADGATYQALAGSVLFTVATTLLATLIGACFAFISTRTTVPLRGLVTPVMLLVLALPTVLYAISWDLLANPGVGILNEPFKALFGTAPLNAESWPGLIFVQSLKLSSFCYFMLLGPFATMNRSYEEASLTSGAGRVRTLLAIDLPVLAPAIFGVVIVVAVFGLGAFDIPQILGDPAGIETLSTRVFQFVTGMTPPRYAAASALALFMVVALVLLVALQSRLTGGREFVTMTGKSYRASRWDLGSRGWPLTALVAGFALVALLLPGAQVVLTSFQSVLGMNSDLGLDNFTAVLDDDRTAGAFRLTLLLAIGGGLLTMVVTTLLAYAGRRMGRGARRYADLVTLAPIVTPGVVLAVGLLWAYISVPGLRQLYGTVWLCLIGMVISVMPVAGRAATGAIAQIGGELEEAAATSGASPARVLRQIVVPLVARSFLAGWLVCGVIVAGMLDVPLMLLPGSDPNVAVMVYGLIYSSGIPTQASALLVLLMLLIAGIGVLYLAVLKLVVPLVRRAALNGTGRT